ncbi:MAG: hypothetical protein KJ787_03060 [Gammaproteobacteria bacterium]|nr:hypothetical protein [Gammaproteobacteria bacterium]MBU1645293.1 hypothetical protein [Gammaproteobacteria bacterium]MBU1971630.1 hypothetical protein [Gammaproteobacteria bacterium]
MTTPIAQGPVDVNVREQACENLAAQVTTSQDGLISSAITLALGEGWTLAQLKGRLLRKVYPDGVEIVSLDETDVLELHPVRFEQVTEGGAIKIKAVQSYRLLRPNVELTGAARLYRAASSDRRERG